MEEVDFYPQKPELIEKESKGSFSSTIFSMVLFVMVLLFVFSDKINFVLLLLIVLLIHELGHFLFMKLFKYKNVRMLFIPLMGAFVNGSKANYSQKESFIVVAAGPMPGIIIGSVLVVLSQGLQQPFLFNAGVMFLLLNVMNLIPLDPLDGGQLFKLLVKKNNELFLLIFSFISSLAMIAIGFFFDFYLLIIFGFLMGFRVHALQKRFQMHKDLMEESVDYKTTYKLLSNKDFSKIKEILLMHTPTLAKYIEVADGDEVDALMASQVNNILVTPTTNDASMLFRIIVVLLWIACLFSPFILFYFIDSDWIRYAYEFSNW